MPSVSMEPTILAGDYFIAMASSAAPRRKELVVYRLAGQVYTKRVVGLPGDTLAMSAGVLVVNSDTVREPYARHDGEESGTDSAFAWQQGFLAVKLPPGLRYVPTVTFWGPILVPPGKYFVLGDNRGMSADSRYTGFINRADIFARPRFIYFSKDRSSGGIRWSRIGRSIPDTR
jgi:signal peptidase I